MLSVLRDALKNVKTTFRKLRNPRGQLTWIHYTHDRKSSIQAALVETIVNSSELTFSYLILVVKLTKGQSSGPLANLELRRVPDEWPRASRPSLSPSS